MSANAFSSLDLTGKVAIVTGAASGLGVAAADLFAARGAAVAYADLDLDGAKAAASAAEERGGKALAVHVDVTQEATVVKMVAEVTASLGGVHILHNNVALMTAHGKDTYVAELDPADFTRTLNVNLVGYMVCAKHCIPVMLAHGGGVIVNTASLVASVSSLTRPMYQASKAGVVGLTRSIATQYGKQGIRCVSVSPAMVLTDKSASRIPSHTLEGVRRHSLIDGILSPADVAELVAFLASDAAAFVTGQDIVLDGGMSAHLPTYADERDAAQGG